MYDPAADDFKMRTDRELEDSGKCPAQQLRILKIKNYFPLSLNQIPPGYTSENNPRHR